MAGATVGGGTRINWHAPDISDPPICFFSIQDNCTFHESDCKAAEQVQAPEGAQYYHGQLVTSLPLSSSALLLQITYGST